MANRISRNTRRDTGTPIGDEAAAYRHAMVGTQRHRRTGLYGDLCQSQTTWIAALPESTSSAEQTILVDILRLETPKTLASGSWSPTFQARFAGD